MVSIYISIAVLLLLLANLVRVMKQEIAHPSVFIIGASLLAITELLIVFFFGVKYAEDAAITLQFFVFLYDAYRGKLFKKPTKNFYDLLYWEKFYLIAYNLVFVGFYFMYVLYTFPGRLSEQLQPIGNMLVVGIIFLLGIFRNVKTKRKDATLFYGNKKKTNTI